MRYGNLCWAIPATIAIAGVWIVSACANWFFGASLGDGTVAIGTITTAELFSGVSLASDLLKAVMLFGLTWAVATRHWMAGLVMGSIWAVCVAWSIFSAVGFVALNSGTVTDKRGKSADEWSQLRKEIERTQERREWVPKHRPVDTVKAELDGIEADFIFVRAKRCTDVTTPESTALCKRFADLKQELGNASAASSLDGKLTTLRSELKTTDRVTSADPFAEMVGALIGSRAANVTMGQALFLAMMLELISGPGLWAVWSAARAPARTPREARTEAKPSTAVTIADMMPSPALRETVGVQGLLPEPPNEPEEKPVPVVVKVEEFHPPRLVHPAPPAPAKKKTNLKGSVQIWRKLNLIEEPAKFSDGRFRKVVTADECWKSYQSWCEMQGYLPVGNISVFGKQVGIPKDRRKGLVEGAAYLGYSLKELEQEQVA